MAKTETAPVEAEATTDDIEIELFEPQEKPGLYVSHVQKLIDADSKRTPEQVEKNIHASTLVSFPTTETKNRRNKETGEMEEVEISEEATLAKYKRFFQDSARQLGRTAREVEVIPQGDGTTRVRFIVVDKISKPRRKSGEDAAEDAPEADAA
jgi:hypothetical protein